MKNLVLVKFGGSVITDKAMAFTAKPGTIARLGKEALAFTKKNPGQLVLAHGGGSFPHQHAHEFETHKGFIQPDSKLGFAKVQDAASTINRIVIDNLLKAGLHAVSLQTSAGVIARDSRIVNWDLSALKLFLKEGFVPVPFGDAVLDEKQGCSIISADEILFYLSKELKPARVIMVGNVDGVFENFPPAKGEAPIAVLNRARFQEMKYNVKGAAGKDVTGGMLHKLERLIDVAQMGVEVQIINGDAPGRFEDALLGKKVMGTTITRD
ncbi:MAG: isopentenyl phosphate kinase [Candidatus Micrarchaeota archaeon]